MSWIKAISYKEATGELKRIYERIKGPNDTIDNVLSIHSLRPHTLIGHMGLYKNVLHNINNTLPKWYLETLGVYVSHLNQCSYCVDHHSAGLKRLLKDDTRFEEIITCLLNDKTEQHFKYQYLAGLKYAKKLTIAHHTIVESDIFYLKEQGFNEGEILEINQVVSYFNYANRTVVGLGVTTEGDIIGLSPNEDSDAENWNHS
ncbi:peroxidase-related enzyme [Aquimarina sp. 2201CG1-2-11]|uniref:carboxymuconolactone decarboxylase family protein n=1 Tax=Aquimarina discodermiae TaxID=3231043 RepID=UPI0034622AD6